MTMPTDDARTVIAPKVAEEALRLVTLLLSEANGVTDERLKRILLQAGCDVADLALRNAPDIQAA